MRHASLIWVGIIALSLIGCSTPSKYFAPEEAATTPSGQSQHGMAAYYHDKFHGRKTSNGEIFDQNKMTAAHRTLPFGTMVKVRNLNNGREVVVRINDRGPWTHDNRIIDLSRVAAEQLDMIRLGVVPVELEILSAQP